MSSLSLSLIDVDVQRPQDQRYQKNLLERFQRAILACFKNFDVNISQKTIQYLSPTYNSDVKVQTNLTYQDVYDMVVRMSKLDISESSVGVIYEVYSECATRWFTNFSELLFRRLQHLYLNSLCSSNQPSIHIAQMLIRFWNRFEKNTLPFIISSFQYAERRRQKTSQRMVKELTTSLFLRNVFDNQPMLSECLTQLIIEYLIDKHQQIYEYLMQKQSSFPLQLETTSKSFNRDEIILMLRDCQFFVIMDLISIILVFRNQDDSSSVVYFKMFMIPFLETYLPRFLSTIPNNLLLKSPSRMSILQYANFASNFIQLQSWFFSSGFFPKESVDQICKFSVYFLLTKQIKKIIYDDERNGFKLMMDKKSYESMSELYSIVVENHYKNTKQKQLLEAFEIFLQKYLDDRLKVFGSKYHFLERRQEAIKFVHELLDERDHWDKVLVTVFKNDHQTPFFSYLITRFYYDLMKINANVTHAMAYFMHELLSKESIILPMNQSLDQVTLDTNYERFALLNKVFFMIVFIKDVNQFFDFTKHYYSIRLLTDSSFLSRDQELEQLDEMNMVIKINFINASNNVEQPFTLFRNNQHFNQNLNDFRNLVEDFAFNSNDFFLKNFHHRKNRNFLKSSSILHAGIWKLTEYDHCSIPHMRIVKTFQEFEKCYLKQEKRRKLLLNTKYSRAYVSMKDYRKEIITLVMTLHQFAIVQQFNQHENRLDYEMIFERTRFQKEYNLRLALLSLIYCGLIRPLIESDTKNLDTLQFEVNDDKTFQKLIESNKCSRNLIKYEQVNFLTSKPLDPSMEEDFAIVVQLITNGEDLSFKSSANSVEELNLTNILNMTKSTTNNLNSIVSRRDRKSVNSSHNNNLMDNINTASTLSHASPSPGCSRSSSSLFQNTLSQSRSSQITLRKSDNLMVCNGSESPNYIERSIKIEAAIVRVLKQIKYLPNLSSVYHAVKMEMSNAQRKHLPSTPYGPNHRSSGKSPMIKFQDHFSIEDIRKSLLQLIQKKYVKRSNDGGFEYFID